MGMQRIPESEWKWFGNAGHLIVGHDCRFHMCTMIGDIMVSTVGQYLPAEGVCEILATSRGKPLEGRGDARRADWLEKFGYEEIGAGRTFETMVLRVLPGVFCIAPNCGCGMPTIIPSELETDGYNTAGEATGGHMRMCDRVASREIGNAESTGRAEE